MLALTALLALTCLLAFGCRDGDVRDAGPLEVQEIIPRQVGNNRETLLLVVGSGFREGATVTLGTTPLPQATFVNDALVTAVVPEGLAPGGYPVTVSLPDGGSARGSTPLTVINARTPEPTPAPPPPPPPPAPTATPRTPTPQPTPAPTPALTPAPTAAPTRTAPPTPTPVVTPTTAATPAPTPGPTRAPATPTATPTATP